MAFADIFKLKRALFQIDNAYLYAQGTKVICVGCALFWNKLLKKNDRRTHHAINGTPTANQQKHESCLVFFTLEQAAPFSAFPFTPLLKSSRLP